MPTVNMFEARSNLSRLVEADRRRSGNHGRPVARLVPVGSSPLGKRIGVARGAFVVPDSIDIDNDEVETLFHGTNPRGCFSTRPD